MHCLTKSIFAGDIAAMVQAGPADGTNAEVLSVMLQWSDDGAISTGQLEHGPCLALMEVVHRR